MKILSFAYSVKRKLSGKPDQVTLEDKLLMLRTLHLIKTSELI